MYGQIRFLPPAVHSKQPTKNGGGSKFLSKDKT
jgi:hypothetical protein